jgi:hypothetical protein
VVGRGFESRRQTCRDGLARADTVGLGGREIF